MAVSPGRAAASIPSAPASDTAAASAGGAAEAMAACWIGTVQPTSSVNLVVIMAAPKFRCSCSHCGSNAASRILDLQELAAKVLALVGETAWSRRTGPDREINRSSVCGKMGDTAASST